MLETVYIRLVKKEGEQKWVLVGLTNVDDVALLIQHNVAIVPVFNL